MVILVQNPDPIRHQHSRLHSEISTICPAASSLFGLEFEVWDFSLRVQGSGFRVED